MADLTLYHIAPSRSSVVHWMLEEVGEPFDIHLLSMSKGENREPAYLAINPMGKVPALRHKDVVITEVPAICCYLADTFPRACLNIPIGKPGRGPYIKWLFFSAGCLEPAIMDHLLKREPAPRAQIGYGDFDTTLDVLEAGLNDAPYLLGEQFTAADVVVGSTLNWAMRMMQAIPSRPAFDRYVDRLTDRPAYQRAHAKDQELSQA
jgi:glutathione S-transferase